MISWACGSDIPVRAVAPSGAPAVGCPMSRRFCETWEPAWISAISAGTADGSAGTEAGAGKTTGGGSTGDPCGSDIPVRAVAGDADVAGEAVTTRGPDGSSESSPRPSALRFSTGLCSSTALIRDLLICVISARDYNILINI